MLNVKDLFVQLLIAIKDLQKGTGGSNVNDLLGRFVTIAKEVRLELIILDDIQTVIQRRSYSVLAGIGDKLKELIDDGFSITEIITR